MLIWFINPSKVHWTHYSINVNIVNKLCLQIFLSIMFSVSNFYFLIYLERFVDKMYDIFNYFRCKNTTQNLFFALRFSTHTHEYQVYFVMAIFKLNVNFLIFLVFCYYFLKIFISVYQKFNNNIVYYIKTLANLHYISIYICESFVSLVLTSKIKSKSSSS